LKQISGGTDNVMIVNKLVDVITDLNTLTSISADSIAVEASVQNTETLTFQSDLTLKIEIRNNGERDINLKDCSMKFSEVVRIPPQRHFYQTFEKVDAVLAPSKF
jgi:hypothetical protein